MKPKFKSGAFCATRYSNFDSGLFVDLGVGGDYSNVDTHQTFTYNQNTGSGWFTVANNFINAASQTLSSIFGHNYSYQTDALQYVNEQERKQNLYLWIALGVALALAVFVIVSKSK